MKNYLLGKVAKTEIWWIVEQIFEDVQPIQLKMGNKFLKVALMPNLGQSWTLYYFNQALFILQLKTIRLCMGVYYRKYLTKT